MGTATATALKFKKYKYERDGIWDTVEAASFVFNQHNDLVFIDHDQRPIAAITEWKRVFEITSSLQELSCPSDELQKVQSLQLA